MERFLMHIELPPFSSKEKFFIIKNRFIDYHQAQAEIIEEAVREDPYMTWSV